MQFIETPIFTKRITSLLSDQDYRLLQLELAIRPDSGDLIKQSGGLRKIRWSGSGRGKRGGIRVIYYFVDAKQQVYMLFAYAKNESDDLSVEQVKLLKNIVMEYLK